MPWRVINTEDEVWYVRPAAERRANNKLWQLTLSFRSENPTREPRAFWASYPLESESKSALFNQADRITDDTLREVLSQHVA